ncbi:hypothetical protein B0H15DRAFT_49403 [Mycena belliarum]|uniref:Uncharacterized protein n=1 Tax=Mycena belliarum TaxID=1033014 RepID=A0AAD6XUD7_9AGAR|nr:hypothetical protein B0H15DRAFT_49403 [Mycena belliae]
MIAFVPATFMPRSRPCPLKESAVTLTHPRASSLPSPGTILSLLQYGFLIGVHPRAPALRFAPAAHLKRARTNVRPASKLRFRIQDGARNPGISTSGDAGRVRAPRAASLRASTAPGLADASRLLGRAQQQPPAPMLMRIMRRDGGIIYHLAG